MTGKELIDQVLMLGLKSQVVYPVQPEAIYTQCNRAIEEVNRLSPVSDTVTILNYPLHPSAYRKGITVHRGGEDMTINASGVMSLAFAVSGSGEATLSIAGRDEVKRFSWIDVPDFKIMRAVIFTEFSEDAADVCLTFTGKYTYMVKDVSFYGEMIGDVEDDIVPFELYKKYDLASELYAGGRFMDFASLPVRFNDVNLNAPYDYKIEGSAIYLPSDKQGAYEVTYFKKPLKIDADNVDFEIEIDARLEDLLALRAGYYFYMVTDREVAERCNAEYLRLQSIVMATIHKVRTPVKFRDVWGW